MESVGNQLRTARTRKALTLEDVRASTRISLHILNAIECDDSSQAGSPFLYRSFVKQFGRCVGLSSEELSFALASATESLAEPLLPGQPGVAEKPKVPGLKPKRVKKLRWVFSFTSLFVMLGACSTFYEQWQTTRAAAQSSGTPTAAVLSRKLPNEKRTADPKAKIDGNAAEVGSSAAESPSAPEAFSLKLSALKNTWLSVIADGHEVFIGVLQADESRTLQGHQTARILTGNAGAVEVVFNGRSLGPLGPEGQTRTVVFTKDSYNVLQSRAQFALANLIPGAR